MFSSEIIQALKQWNDNPSIFGTSSAKFLKQKFVEKNRNEENRVELYSEIAQVLFRRCIEKPYVGQPKIDNPIFIIAPIWFDYCPTLETKQKLFPILRRIGLESLDEVRNNPNLIVNENSIVECMNLFDVLLNYPDFPDFAVTYLKLQRFSIDGLGRHIRRKESDLVGSSRSLFATLKILFKHSNRVLFDPNPSLCSFFDMYSRWNDDPLLAQEVITFVTEYSEEILKKTAVFFKFRGELLHAYRYETCQGNLQELIGLWSKKSIVSHSKLLLEALSEDFEIGILPSKVIDHAPTNEKKLEAIKSAFQAEHDGAIQKIPINVLNSIQNSFFLDTFLELVEKEEFIFHLAIGLNSECPTTAARVCWILGEFGSKRDWRFAFDAIRTYLAIATLSSYERNAAISAILKFGILDNQYAEDTFNSLSDMAIECSQRDKALAILTSSHGIGRLCYSQN